MPVSRSPSAGALPLSMRPWTSRIVTSPTASSRSSTGTCLPGVVEAPPQHEAIAVAHPRVPHLAHESFHEMDAEPAHLTIGEGRREVRRGYGEGIERLAVVLDLDLQH